MEPLSKNKIKLIRSLRQKKNRDQENLFVVEGKKNVLEACRDFPDLVEFICTNDSHFSENLPVFYAENQTMHNISRLQSARDYLGIFKKPDFKALNQKTTIILDGIQDPGNLGTILRTADWFGIDHFVCSMDTVDAYNEKVVQSTMGSIFRVQVEYTDLSSYLSTQKRPVFGALMEGENIYSMELPIEGIYILGNEGKGIRTELTSEITHPIHIPGKGNAESLNVSIAAGIIMSEVSRGL